MSPTFAAQLEGLLLAHLPWLLSAYWAVLIVLVGVKSLSPGFDKYSSYGLQNDNLSRGVVTRQIAFLLFYMLGLVLGVAAAIAQGLGAPLRTALVVVANPAVALGLAAARAETLPQFVGFGKVQWADPQIVPGCLFVVQMARRAAETMWVQRYSLCERLPLLMFLGGCTFYVAMGLTVTVDQSPLLLPTEAVPWLPKVLLCGAVFAFASYRQYQCHSALAQIRPKTMDLHCSARHYRAPTAALFREMACPHYFFEIVLYSALLALRPTLNMTLAWGFVVLNLAQRGRKTRRFYCESFGPGYAPRCSVMPSGPTHLAQ
eukprot:RCo046055